MVILHDAIKIFENGDFCAFFKKKTKNGFEKTGGLFF